MYVVDADDSTVRKITPAGVVTTIAGTPNKYGDPTGPLPGKRNAVFGIAVNGAGNVYLSQSNGIVQIAQP